LLNFLGRGGGVKQPGHGVSHTLPFGTGAVEFYLYMSGPSWPFTGRTLPLPSPRFQYLLICCLSSIRDLLLTIKSQSKAVLVAADTAALLSCPAIDHCKACMNGVYLFIYFNLHSMNHQGQTPIDIEIVHNRYD
jgi:hypothetical protein